MANFIPNYEQLMPSYIQAIRNGSEVERNAAEADLLELAKFADLYLRRCVDDAEAKAKPYVEDLMKRLDGQ
jgi:hypothetical protein